MLSRAFTTAAAALTLLGSACSATDGGRADPPAPSTTTPSVTDPSAPAAPADPTSTPTSPIPTVATGGCSALSGAVPLGGGRTMTVRSPAASDLRPAVVVLHGYTGSPAAIESTSGWTGFAAGEGALVAYPQGTSTPDGGFGWNTASDRFSTSGVDDVAFIATALDELITSHCVDPDRVILAGESNGGAMAVRATCDDRVGERVSLTAAVIPAVDDATIEGCRDGPPIHLIAVAGRKDRTVPYDGASVNGLEPLLGQETWFTRVATWRNGCDDLLTSVDIAQGSVLTPASCTESTPTLVALDAGVHTWPGGPVGTAGLDPGTFDANQFIWDQAGW